MVKVRIRIRVMLFICPPTSHISVWSQGRSLRVRAGGEGWVLRFGADCWEIYLLTFITIVNGGAVMVLWLRHWYHNWEVLVSNLLVIAIVSWGKALYLGCSLLSSLPSLWPDKINPIQPKIDVLLLIVWDSHVFLLSHLINTSLFLEAFAAPFYITHMFLFVAGFPVRRYRSLHPFKSEPVSPAFLLSQLINWEWERAWHEWNQIRLIDE